MSDVEERPPPASAPAEVVAPPEREATREELLDNTPEAVAMRRARAARAEATRAPARPAPRRFTRRGVLLAVLGGIGAARVISGLAGRQGP